MNMKTTKFLAVLAVLAFAFAAFAVALPAQENEATAGEAISNPKVQTDAAITQFDSKNLILTEGIEYTIAPTVVDATYGLYLLDGASIKIVKGEATAFTSPGIIVGAATATEANSTTTYNHANQSKIVFANEIRADYVIKNNGGVIEITSTSEYLTQNNITVTIESSWGGEFAIDDVKILEKGELVDVIIPTTQLYAGVANATTIVTKTITVIQQTAGVNLEARGDLYLNGGMVIKNTDNTKTGTITLTSAAKAAMTGEITAFGNVIVADSCNGGFTASSASNVTITSITAGDMTLNSGAFIFGTADSMSIGDDSNAAKLTVGKKATLTPGTTNAATFLVKNKSTLVLYGTINAGTAGSLSISNDNGTADDEGKFVAYSGANFGQGVYITMAADYVSVSAALQEEGITSGTLTSDKVYNQLQDVHIKGNYTIGAGVTMTVLGKLTIDAGATLTIVGTANLVLGTATGITSYTTVAEINGEIDILKSGTVSLDVGNGFDISGTVVCDGTLTVGTAELGAKTTFKNGSDLDVSSNGKIELYGTDNLKFAKGSEGTIEGTLEFGAASAAILVAGELEIDGSVTLAAADLNATSATNYIYTVGNGAKINLSSVKLTAEANNRYLAISDKGTSLKDSAGSSIKVTTGNYVTIGTEAAAANQVVSGLVIEQTAFIYDLDGYEMLYSNLDLYGSISTSTANVINIVLTNTNTADTKVVNTMTVGKELSIGEDIQFTNTSATLSIDGEMYKTVAGEPVELNANDSTYGPKTTVTGLLSVVDKAEINYINAAYYETTVTGVKYYNYTSFDSAVALGIDFKLFGNIYVTEDIDIPAPVKVDATAAKIFVGTTDDRTVTLTVKDGAKLTSDNIEVIGSLVYEDYTTGKKVNGEIVSDVFVTDGLTQVYTNIYTAIAISDVGSIITVTKDTDPVELDKSLTIPTGVTVTLDAGKALKLDKGVVLTVDGILVSWDALQKESGATFVDKSVIDPTDEVKLVVNGVFASVATTTYANYAAPGAYYKYTDEEATYNMITNFEIVPEYIDDAAKTVSIYGAVTATDVTIAGDYKITIEIAADSSLSMGTLGLKKAVLDVPSTSDGFTGKVASEEGALKITNADGFNVEQKTYKGEGLIQLSGTSIARAVSAGAKLSFSIAEGIVFASGAVSIASLTVASDAVLTIDGTGNSVTNTATTTINGSIIVSDAGKFSNENGKVQVLGSLIILPADLEDGTAAGSASIKELYVGQKADDTYTTDAAAIVTGTEIADLKIAFVTADSMISEEIVSGLIKSTFTVEGEAYLTVYAASNASGYYVQKVLCPELEDSVFKNWQYTTSSGVVTDVDATTLFTTARDYTALVKYDIYDVIIYTDAGVKAVSIDGIELYNGNTNKFELPTGVDGLLAGTHTVTFTMKAGYEGTPTLKTVDGTILKDYKFVTSGEPETGDYVIVSLQLSGTEPIPEPEPVTPEEKSEWTVTTILLVVLVILIAIMAVIVALRLNRN